MTIQLLRPGESSLIDFTVSATFEYPLDSILVVPHQAEQLHYVAQALGHARRAPWMPVLIGIGRVPLPARELDALTGGLQVAALPCAVGERVEVEAIRAAIRGRSLPTSQSFAKWCEIRIERLNRSLLQKALGKERMSRAEVRELTHSGGLGPVQWRALFLLIQLHSDSWPKRRSLEWLAFERQSTRKTVWDWGNKLLGMSWSRLERITVREAIVELALRRQSHVAAHEVRLSGEGQAHEV